VWPFVITRFGRQWLKALNSTGHYIIDGEESNTKNCETELLITLNFFRKGYSTDCMPGAYLGGGGVLVMGINIKINLQ
jgi:hypothetical protein